MAAEQIYRKVATDPFAPLVAGITGPGGTGKTALLDALARLHEHAGARVIRDAAAAEPDAVVLIDDAHLLPDELLAGLRRLVGGQAVRLVVAYRPWPRPSGLSELTAALGRSPVLLGPLDLAGVAARLARWLPAESPAAVVEMLLQRTGGLPALLDGLARNRDAQCRDAQCRDAQCRDEVPPTVLAQVRDELDRADPAVRGLLLAVAVAGPLDPEIVGELLGLGADALADVVLGAQATGLMLADETVVPLAREAVQRLVPPGRRRIEQRLAEILLSSGAPVAAAARRLLGLTRPVRGVRVAAVFEAAGDEELAARPAMAGEFFAAAVDAGAPAAGLAVRRAQAAALAGEHNTALRLADQVLADPASPDRPQAVAVTAAVLAQRGLLARGAELYRGLGAEPIAASAPLGVVALIGIGALAEARAALAALEDGRHRPLTLLAGAESLMARGIYDTVGGSPTAGLSMLARAAALLEPSDGAVPLPDTPAALAALVALGSGQADIAGSVLDRALASGLGGVAAQPRHRLLRAWIAMLAGHDTAAQELLDSVAGAASVTSAASGVQAAGGLTPRDELMAVALRVGLARRTGDPAALRAGVARAREIIVAQSADLFMLGPLGELAVASARLRSQDWLAPQLAEARSILARLGDPVLWAAPMHWSQLHAAIIAEQPALVTRSADALAEAASTSRYAGILACAADSWLRVLAGDVDAPAVESVARELQAVGLGWDAARLAGQAALRTTDRKAMIALLGCARALRSGASASVSVSVSTPGPGHRPGPSAVDDSGGTEPGPQASRSVRSVPADPRDLSADALSDREREVAALMLAGLTYREIGERLFISAKTVEHHVARMRQRLGSSSRSELFAQLRSLIEDRAAGGAG